MMQRRLVLLPLLLTACSHAEPFGDGKPGSNGPFSSATPVRLTYNLGKDMWPTWSPDGRSIWYSAQDSIAPDHDQCLDILPAEGGTRQEGQCPGSIQNNVTEILQQPTILDGTLAYAVADLGTFPPEHAQYRFNIWMASTVPGATPQRVMPFPYLAPSGKTHDGPISLRWVRPGLLAYIGFEAGCCNKDTLRFGEQVVLLQLSGDTGIRTFVPDTYRASALGVSADGLSLYYTVYGGSKVYQRNLASGSVTIVHDFGAGQVVRDPDIVGTRLAAIIGGQHDSGDLPPFDSVSVDKGGELVVLDLPSGQASQTQDNLRWWKRPRLSPDGSRVVLEGYSYSLVGLPPDTIVSRTGDIWLLEE